MDRGFKNRHVRIECLDLPTMVTRETHARGYKHQAGNSQYLLITHWFIVSFIIEILNGGFNMDRGFQN